MEGYLGVFGFQDDFFDITLKAQSMKEKIDKLDFIKIKNFCSVKGAVRRTRGLLRGVVVKFCVLNFAVQVHRIGSWAQAYTTH